MYSPEFNRSLIVSRWTSMTKKMNLFLRRCTIGKRLFSWFDISPSSLPYKYGSCRRAGRFSFLCFCFCLRSVCKITRIQFQRILFELHFLGFLFVVVQVRDQLVQAMRNSDSWVKTVLVHRQFCACDLRALRQLLLGFEANPRAITFSPITQEGNAPAGGRSTFPAITLVWLTVHRAVSRAEEYDRPATQSIATPKPSSRTIPTLDRTLVARWSLWVCHHTWEPTVLSSGKPRPISLQFWKFSPALPVSWAHFQDTWGLSSPYHVADTYPLRVASLFLLCVSLGGFLPRRLEGTTEGC